MMTGMFLCASMLFLGEPQAAVPQPSPVVEQAATAAPAKPAETSAPPDVEQPASATEKKENDSRPDADEGQTKDASQTEALEEKEIDGVKLAAIEANLVSYTNEQRVKHGLPPLEVDKDLMETAREQAAWMTRNRALIHTRRPLAENIAMGQPHSSDAVQAWMNSPGHRANILNPGHRRIGVAAYRAASGVIYWCQQFRR